MRGLKRLRSAQVISTGHAFVQNLCRGHYELGVDLDPRRRLPVVFTELVLACEHSITVAACCPRTVNASLPDPVQHRAPQLTGPSVRLAGNDPYVQLVQRVEPPSLHI
jgi:hypothetical protein